MNIIRSAIFALFAMISVATFSASASAQTNGATCVTLSQATDAFNQIAAEHGQTAVINVYSGEDAQLVRDYIAAKYANNDVDSVIEFDTFALVNSSDGTQPFGVALKDGCIVAQTSISIEDYTALKDQVLGK